MKTLQKLSLICLAILSSLSTLPVLSMSRPISKINRTLTPNISRKFNSTIQNQRFNWKNSPLSYFGIGAAVTCFIAANGDYAYNTYQQYQKEKLEEQTFWNKLKYAGITAANMSGGTYLAYKAYTPQQDNDWIGRCQEKEKLRFIQFLAETLGPQETAKYVRPLMPNTDINHAIFKEGIHRSHNYNEKYKDHLQDNKLFQALILAAQKDGSFYRIFYEASYSNDLKMFESVIKHADKNTVLNGLHAVRNNNKGNPDIENIAILRKYGYQDSELAPLVKPRYSYEQPQTKKDLEWRKQYGISDEEINYFIKLQNLK